MSLPASTAQGKVVPAPEELSHLAVDLPGTLVFGKSLTDEPASSWERQPCVTLQKPQNLLPDHIARAILLPGPLLSGQLSEAMCLSMRTGNPEGPYWVVPAVSPDLHDLLAAARCLLGLLLPQCQAFSLLWLLV